MATVQVDQEELTELIQQNQQLKNDNGAMRADIREICGAFSGLQDIFSGKMGTLGLVGAITKLINDPERMSGLEKLLPIIEKYTENNNHEQKALNAAK